MNFQAHLLTDELSNHEKILPKRIFCQEFIYYHGKAVFHSCLEIHVIGQLYRKVIVFQQNATQILMTQWPYIVILIVNNSSKIEITKSITNIKINLSISTVLLY